MTDREFKELLYREKHATRIALTDLIRESLLDHPALFCYPPEVKYRYDHWEDAVVDDPWEGPIGITYGFYIRIQEFYVWCGFTFSERVPATSVMRFRNMPDMMLLLLNEKPTLPASIPKDPHRREPYLDRIVWTILSRLGFSQDKSQGTWERLYKIVDFPKPGALEAMATPLVTAIEQLGEGLCNQWRPADPSITEAANTFLFTAQTAYGVNLHYEAASIVWVERYIEECRQKRIRGEFDLEEVPGMIRICGAYLGECIRFNYGGYGRYDGEGGYGVKWEEVDGALGLKFSDGNVAFPFNRVRQQFEHGPAYSVTPLYAVIPEVYKADLSRNTPAQQAFQAGLTAVMIGKPDQAIEHFSRAIALNPFCIQAYYHRALAYDRIGEWEDAIRDYTEVIKFQSVLHWPDIYYSRGVCYGRTGVYWWAVGDLNQIIRLNPRYAGAYGSRGLAYRLWGKLEPAMEDFNKAIELDPRNSAAYHNRGVAYAKSGDLASALRDFDEAIRLEPENFNFYYSRSLAYIKLGDLPNAIESLRRILKLDTDDTHKNAARRRIADLEAQMKASAPEPDPEA